MMPPEILGSPNGLPKVWLPVLDGLMHTSFSLKLPPGPSVAQCFDLVIGLMENSQQNLVYSHFGFKSSLFEEMGGSAQAPLSYPFSISEGSLTKAFFEQDLNLFFGNLNRSGIFACQPLMSKSQHLPAAMPEGIWHCVVGFFGMLSGHQIRTAAMDSEKWVVYNPARVNRAAVNHILIAQEKFILLEQLGELLNMEAYDLAQCLEFFEGAYLTRQGFVGTRQWSNLKFINAVAKSLSNEGFAAQQQMLEAAVTFLDPDRIASLYAHQVTTSTDDRASTLAASEIATSPIAEINDETPSIEDLEAISSEFLSDFQEVVEFPEGELDFEPLEDTFDDSDDLFGPNFTPILKSVPEPQEVLESGFAAIPLVNLLSQYLNEMGRTPLLTHQEEIHLAQVIENGKAAERALASERDGIETQRRWMLERMIEEKYRARQRFIESNQRLIVSISKGYRGRGLEWLDLIQEGNFGLMRAIDLFDYKLGYKFSTYATWWIRQATNRALADQGRTIRIPVHMTETIRKLKRTKYKLENQLSRMPTGEELAASMGSDWTPEKVENALALTSTNISLECLIADGIEFHNFYGSEETIYWQYSKNNIEQKVLAAELNSALAALPDREAEILCRRFGLYGNEQHTLEETGVVFSLTRERIRQLENKAIRKLRYNGRQSRSLQDLLED
jgi:RNA polymerase primary sigma factor